MAEQIKTVTIEGQGFNAATVLDYGSSDAFVKAAMEQSVAVNEAMQKADKTAQATINLSNWGDQQKAKLQEVYKAASEAMPDYKPAGKSVTTVAVEPAKESAKTK